MKLSRRVFLVGGHITPFLGKGHPNFIHAKHPDFGKRANPTLEELLRDAVTGALQATGVAPGLVQQAWVGNFAGELFCNQGHLGAAIAGCDPAFRFLPSMRVEGACASGGLAYASAVQGIQAGLDVALVAGVEVQTTVSAREGGKFLASASHYREQGKLDDFTFPCMFAMRIKAYAEKYGLSREEYARQLAHVSAKAYGNGNKNPLAHMNAVKMSVERASTPGDANPLFLSNPEYKPYLKVSDCSQVSDGGAAMVLVSEQGLKKLGIPLSKAVEVVSIATTTDNLYNWGNLTEMENSKQAAKIAYDLAGVGAKQIQVAEVHDCFTMAEVMMCEAMGFAKPGEGAQLAISGDSHITGSIPVNTGGGLIAFGHPVGATGVKMALEVYKQMKGQSGAYQIKKSIEHGLTANMGGADKTTVVSIMRNC